MRRLALVVITAVVAFLCFRGRGVAQPTPGNGSDEIEMGLEGSGSGSGSAAPVKDPKVAKKWLTAAQQLVVKGDAFAKQKKPDEARPQWENAATAFDKAIEAGDDVNVYVDLAGVEDKLERFGDAVAHYKLVIAGSTKPAMVKQAQGKLDELTARIGFVMLTITPDETAIMLGDKQLGVSPLKEPLVLGPGSYKLTLTSAGYDPKELEIKVDAGSESERKVDLVPKKAEIQHVDTPEPPPQPPPTPEVKMWPLYAGAGATAGLFVTGVITGIAAVSKHHTLTAPDTSRADRLDAQSSGRRLAHVTDACFGGAVIAAGFTAYYYLYRYKPAHDAVPTEHKEAKLEVLPWVQPGAGGITAVGRF